MTDDNDNVFTTLEATVAEKQCQREKAIKARGAAEEREYIVEWFKSQTEWTHPNVWAMRIERGDHLKNETDDD